MVKAEDRLRREVFAGPGVWFLYMMADAIVSVWLNILDVIISGTKEFYYYGL